jgi:2'-5' RNA ligase
MENIQTMMPGYKLNEYLVVLSPNEDLRNRISGIRREFNEAYGPSVPLNGKPHLALVRFVTWSMQEEKLVNRFLHIAMGFVPFKVELMDFGSFPSHSIYINVATKVPVQSLVRELRSVQKLMRADPGQEPHFIAEPFIPVARKLLPWQYEKGWLEYSHRHFSAKMIADGMLLLKRPVGEKSYRVVQRFEFMNMPVATTQGELFF